MRVRSFSRGDDFEARKHSHGSTIHSNQGTGPVRQRPAARLPPFEGSLGHIVIGLGYVHGGLESSFSSVASYWLPTRSPLTRVLEGGCSNAFVGQPSLPRDLLVGPGPLVILPWKEPSVGTSHHCVRSSSFRPLQAARLFRRKPARHDDHGLATVPLRLTTRAPCEWR